MMGRQHAVTGMLAGIGLAAAFTSAPPGIRALLVAVAGGAALLPDLDHPQATAARSLGLVTKAIAHSVDWVSVAAYHATRTAQDPQERRSGHRLLTHTVPACVAAGGAVAVAGWLYLPALTVVCGVLTGLLGLGLRAAGAGLAAAGAAAAWWLLGQYPTWAWTVAVAVTVGCLVHIAGDWVTNSGVPVLWPLRSGGQRWRFVHAPATFAAGDWVETRLVAPLLLVSLGVAAVWVTGGFPVLIAIVEQPAT